MYRIGLNRAKSDNYTFFCPDAPMHLNICQPVASTNRLTSSILRGIKGGTLIDYDNIMSTINPKNKEIVEEVVVEVVEEVVEEVKKVKKEKPKTTKKKKKGDE